jgi:hypothetical protein
MHAAGSIFRFGVQADALADRIKAMRATSFAAVAGRMEASEERERAMELSLLRLGTAVRFSCIFGGGGPYKKSQCLTCMMKRRVHAARLLELEVVITFSPLQQGGV